MKKVAVAVALAAVAGLMTGSAPAADPTRPLPAGGLPVKEITPLDRRGVAFGLTQVYLGQYLTANLFGRTKEKEELLQSGAVWVSDGPVQAVYEIDVKTPDGVFGMVRPLSGPFAGKLVAVEKRFVQDAKTTQQVSYPQSQFKSFGLVRTGREMPAQTGFINFSGDDTYLPPVVGWASRDTTAGSGGPVYVHDYYRQDGTHVNAYWRSRPSR